MNKTILVASFVFPDKIDWFIDLLSKNFNIKKENVFMYKNLDDDTKVIITFKLILINGEKINLNKILPNATIIHKKGNAIYTINALNLLINFENSDNMSNLSYEHYEVDWSKYQDKMLITNKTNLVFINIQRIF